MRPVVRVPLTYGIIGGVLGAGLTTTLYYLGPHPFLMDVYFDYRIVLFTIFIFFTLKELRDYYHAGILYFWQGLIASFIFVSAFAVIASLIIWVLAMSITEFVSSYITLSVERLRNLPPEIIERIGKDVYERNLEIIPSTNAADLALLYFGQCFIIGTFISIILSVITRRQPKP